eukprot:CAMPEP_0198340120 /NCGR_PEP_ID=MMETSP1450-20131203/42507_1 /TAXON_ID=753684 ORGANISM="Madagascaria erythrocladiodes, Strain CCMP3234" /NCGR_SAMPLE_ID=MMETSP1450 /ASSEMBLY_ACC=CAM_ASM_001115 /LENGTH=461 /DNA_ID=CAMNT_0044045085 /DNA_START=36 /DNA_END=1417 /DNA_ORIENTATION=-
MPLFAVALAAASVALGARAFLFGGPPVIEDMVPADKTHYWPWGGTRTVSFKWNCEEARCDEFVTADGTGRLVVYLATLDANCNHNVATKWPEKPVALKELRVLNVRKGQAQSVSFSAAMDVDAGVMSCVRDYSRFKIVVSGVTVIGEVIDDAVKTDVAGGAAFNVIFPACMHGGSARGECMPSAMCERNKLMETVFNLADGAACRECCVPKAVPAQQSTFLNLPNPLASPIREPAGEFVIAAKTTFDLRWANIEPRWKCRPFSSESRQNTVTLYVDKPNGPLGGLSKTATKLFDVSGAELKDGGTRQIDLSPYWPNDGNSHKVRLVFAVQPGCTIAERSLFVRASPCFSSSSRTVNGVCRPATCEQGESVVRSLPGGGASTDPCRGVGGLCCESRPEFMLTGAFRETYVEDSGAVASGDGTGSAADDTTMIIIIGVVAGVVALLLLLACVAVVAVLMLRSG